MKFLILEKQSADNFHESLTNVYGDSAPLYATITRRVAEFKRGRLMEDDHRAGRPVEVTTDDCCHAVEMLMMRDQRVRSCR